jgi:hypothetical protein
MENETMSFTAQPNGPRGLSPVKAQSGTPNRANTYQVAGNGSDKLYRGQPVKLDTNGQVVILAVAADPILGVADGVEYVDANGDIRFSPFWPAPGSVATGSVVKLRVFDGSDELFEIFANADLAQNDIGAYFDFSTVTGVGGSDITGQSSLQLDVASKAATPADAQVVLRAFGGKPGDLRSAIVQFVDPLTAGAIG